MKTARLLVALVLAFSLGIIPLAAQTQSPGTDPLGLGTQEGSMSASDVQAPSPAPSAAGRGEAPPVRRSAECDPYLDPNCIGAMDPSRVPIGPSSVQPPSTPSLPQGAVANLGVKGLEHEELTEFQQFASDAVGTLLPIFGRSLFTAVPSTFAPVDGGVAVSSDYVIGPGDELYIQVSGQINFASRVPVDRSGQIYFPKVGTIPVAGVRYGELADYLKSNIGRVFRNFDLAVNLGRLRSIHVLVVGHARRPGSYTISSLSTLTNAIFASGGPSVRGSMRRIQVRRGERMVTELDLYDLLLGGDKTKDVFLQDGDVIFIPPVGPQVAIAGSVNVPAIYELKNAAALETQVAAAGGLTTVASTQKVTVERIEHRSVRVVREMALDSAGLKFQLQDGDIVRIYPIVPRFENAVTLRGNVAQPGRFPWHEGMKIRDLIPNKEFLLTRKFWQNQNQLGEGAAVTSTQKERVTSEALHSQIKRSAPEINWDYAVIQRVNAEDLTTRLIPFNLSRVVIENDVSENLPLLPGDIVTVFSQEDLTVPTAKTSKFIRLEGEFKSPGIYQSAPGETLRSLVDRAGGFTPQAYVFGAQLTRESARIEQQQSIDELVRNMDAELQQAVVAGSGSVDAATLQAQSQQRKALVDRFRQIRPIGRVVLEIKPSDSGTGALPELTLEDGDRLFVPYKPTTVSVVGSVHSPNSFIFRPGTKIDNYLKLAGKGTRNADLGNAFIIRVDGSVISKRTQSGFWSGGVESARALPGDVVVVPVKINRGAWIRALRDWSQLASQIALTAASLAVIAQ